MSYIYVDSNSFNVLRQDKKQETWVMSINFSVLYIFPYKLGSDILLLLWGYTLTSSVTTT